GMPRTGGYHSERFVEFFFRRCLPFHAVGFNRCDGCRRYPEVRVGVVRAETAVGMLITQAAQDFGAAETEIFQQIPRVSRQAASMRVHVADSDLMRNPWLEHDK